MKSKLILASVLLPLVVGCAANAETMKSTETTDAAKVATPPVYNTTFNPRQKEYPNHLGFNDLHIQAIRHLVPDTHDVHDPNLRVVVHHHCKAYDDSTMVCLMFHSGMKDQDKPIGFEYIIPTAAYNTLPDSEKKYWHYHETEIPRAKATLPDLTADEAAPLMPAIGATYGKVVYFQNPHDKLPLGEPYVVIVQDMPEQD